MASIDVMISSSISLGEANIASGVGISTGACITSQLRGCCKRIGCWLRGELLGVMSIHYLYLICILSCSVIVVQTVGLGTSFETTSEQVIGTEACFIQNLVGRVERNDGTIGDTTLLPIHLTFVELTLGKFTDGVGVLLASVLRFRTNCFGGCAGI